MTSSTPHILIIGAGALGLTSGYHLQLGGAEITFLVREHRVEGLSRPQKLYCCNDHSLKTFQNFRVVSEVETLSDQTFDFALLTLDGATCRSDQGSATLKALGSALAGTGTRLMINGVGIGLYEHVKETTGLSESEIMQGTMGMYAYQVGQPNTPHPENLNETLYQTADLAYITFPEGTDFVVTSKIKSKAREFTELFNRCGVARCKMIPDGIFTMFSNSFFPFTTACEINHWQGTEALIADRELWHLCCQSKREIMGLKRNGVIGKLFSLLMSDTRQEKMMRESDRQAAAMGFTAFNRFHHGGKVQQQDIQIMENCLAAGEQHGQNMAATRELLARWYQLHGRES